MGGHGPKSALRAETWRPRGDIETFSGSGVIHKLYNNLLARSGRGKEGAYELLEQLVAQWHEYQGYFVRRNILVGRCAKGGYECELEVVAFNPRGPSLVNYETSMDALSWAERDRKFRKKLACGRRYIPEIFPGIMQPTVVEQRAFLYFANKKNRDTVGGQPLVLVAEFLPEVFEALADQRVASNAIHEHLPILRTLQVVADQRPNLAGVLGDLTG